MPNFIKYESPIGMMILVSEHNKLIGSWFVDQKFFPLELINKCIENNQDNLLIRTKEWLNRYFNNLNPSIDELDLDPRGSEFQKLVWKKLTLINYGELTSYKELARIIAKEKKMDKMSSQAIGNALKHNPISIIIPCHRVIGTNGDLVGYAGGLTRKKYLIEHEKIKK